MSTPGVTDIKWFATDIKGNQSAVQTQRVQIGEQGTVGGSVPATLALTLGAPADVRRVHAGCGARVQASSTATVISARPATRRCRCSEPGLHGQRRVHARRAAAGRVLQVSWTAPTSNESVGIAFKQLIKANDPLRTGTYSKTLTFTLSTTQP